MILLTYDYLITINIGVSFEAICDYNISLVSYYSTVEEAIDNISFA